MANIYNYENIEESEQAVQCLDETYEEFRDRCRNNNPFYD